MKNNKLTIGEISCKYEVMIAFYTQYQNLTHFCAFNANSKYFLYENIKQSNITEERPCPNENSFIYTFIYQFIIQ